MVVEQQLLMSIYEHFEATKNQSDNLLNHNLYKKNISKTLCCSDTPTTAYR